MGIKKITVQMASIPSRIELLKIAVESLLPQVDFMRIMLNNYSEVPDFLKHEKIETIRRENILEDGEKFYKADTNEGIVCVCDDDLLYPTDYVYKMRTKLQMYPNAILTCLGKNLHPRPIKSYYRDMKLRLGTFDNVLQDTIVEVVGTGCMAYDSEFIKLSERDMVVPNSDVCVSVYAKVNKIQCICIEHKSDWFINLMTMIPENTPSICSKYSVNDNIQTDFINKYL